MNKELEQTQAILKAAMDCSPAGIAIADAPNGKLRYVNDAGLLMRGGDRKSIVDGVGVDKYVASWQLLDLDGRPLQMEEVPLARAMMFGETNSREFIIRREDGEDCIVLANAAPIKDSSGVVTAAVVVFTDITYQKKAEKKMSDISERLRLATHAGGLGIWDWDIKNNTMHWDERMLRLYGLTRETFPGGIQAWKNGLHPEDRGRTIAECEAALRGERLWDTEFRVLHPSGEILHLKANGIVHWGTDGAPERMLGVNVDITARKKAEQAQLEIQTQLLHSAKLASIGTLAAGVAHEINNPLTIVKGHIGLIESEIADMGGSEKIQKYLAKQMKAIDRVADIVNGLRTFARADSDIVESVDVHMVIRDTLALCETIYVKDGITVNVNLSAASSSIQGNIGKLQQVIMNLLSNAKDACESLREGGIITLDTAQDNGFVVIRISDNGTGISKDQLTKIFDPFFTTKPVGKGTGLGLPISSAIVRSFGGTFTVESELGFGSTFIIRLPLTITAQAQAQTSSIAYERKFSGRALVVDDEEDIRDLLVTFVSSLGVAVSAAKDGEEALAILENKYFDYVITDINMPKMHGDALLERATQLPHLSKTRFIVVTGGIVTDYNQKQRETIRKLAHGYIRKPFDKGSLAETIEKVQVQ